MADELRGGDKGLVQRVAMVAAMGGLLFGFDTGVISGVLLFLRDQFNLSPVAQEVVVSQVLVGAIIGAALGGRMSDAYGRRPLIIACAVVFLAGSLLSASAWSFASLVASRVVIGLAIGVTSVVVPLYISEIAPPEKRGALVSLNQLMITIGIVLSYLVDTAFSSVSQGWRWMLGAGVVPAVVLGVGMLFLPQSPRWLMSKRRGDEARRVMRRLRGTQEVEAEMDAMAETMGGAEKPSWGELAKPWIRPALVMGVIIMFIQQATGINTVIYYAPTIFQMAGFESATAAIAATVGIGLVNVLFTVVSIRYIDRWGRKRLLSVGLAGMLAGLVALGLAFALEGSLGGSLRWVAVGSVVLYIASFAFSLGPVAWVLVSEIFPLRVRGMAVGVATLCNWAFDFMVAMSFLSIIDLLGKSGTFFLFAGISAAGWLYCAYFIPETRGCSLEQIEASLKLGRPCNEGQEA